MNEIKEITLRYSEEEINMTEEMYEKWERDCRVVTDTPLFLEWLNALRE